MAKEIFIYGTIGRDWWTGEGNTAKGLIKELQAAGEKEEVHIRINSPGGDVVEGIAMYNAIATHKGKTITINDGLAASMGFILLQAGDERKSYLNATALCHNCSGMAWGNAKDLKATAELLDKLDDGLIESIAQKSGKTAEDIKKQWFDYTDHTLNAKEMLAEGMIDELIQLNTEGAPEDVANLSAQELFAAYAKIQKPTGKKSFMAELLSEIKALIKGEPAQPTDSTNTEEDMKVTVLAEQKALAATLGLTFTEGQTSQEVELTAEQLTAIEAKLAADAKAAADAIAAKQAADAALVTAQAEIAKLNGSAGAEQKNPLVTDENHKHKANGIDDTAPHNVEADAALKNY